jgi:hypothetical protein
MYIHRIPAVKYTKQFHSTDFQNLQNFDTNLATLYLKHIPKRPQKGSSGPGSRTEKSRLNNRLSRFTDYEKCWHNNKMLQATNSAIFN